MAHFCYALPLVALLLLSACTPQTTGRVVKATDSQSEAMLYCSLGSELRVSELNGRSRTCFNADLDIFQLSVESYDREVVGLMIELTGSNSSTNISYYPSERSVVFRYEIPRVSHIVGQLRSVTVYPVVEAQGDQLVCRQHPLRIEIEEC